MDTNASCAAPLYHVLREEEMAAVDSFGPLTRRAFNEGPLSVLAAITLREVEPYHLDLQDPRVDAALAEGLRKLFLDLLLLDRPREDAELGLRPLVPRRLERPQSPLRRRR